MKYVTYLQHNKMDCGPTCLRIISKYYGKYFNTNTLKGSSGYSKEGVSLLGISKAAENIGFRSRGVQITYDQLAEKVMLPCILHWKQNHFVVLFSVKRGWGKSEKIIIADPASGIITYKKEEFLKNWIGNQNSNGEGAGIALLLEPTADFYENVGERENKQNWGRIFQYLKQSKFQVFQIILALLVTSSLQIIFPFLTQSIVDTGINTQNLQFITIVLLAQMMLIFSRTVVDFIRSRILLNVSININFSLISDFWIKLTRLPISYFDTYHTGDTLQRLGDTKSIETFLTGSALNTIFSLFNFVILSSVLIKYSLQLFLIFAVGALLYFLWIRFFLKFRRKINYQSFHFASKENTASLQMIQGMQELKLNNAENIKRWEWENIQASIFKLSFKNLSFSQLQQAGALFINESKNTFITFWVASLVLKGELSLGAMLAIQYIIGQLNSPIEQFIGFIQSAQDAKISLERISEIYDMPDEESSYKSNEKGLDYLPENRSIHLSNLTFSYPGSNNNLVINNISLKIPAGRTTAIVGVSGSGKTTLLKLLLKFYEEYTGDISIGTEFTGDFTSKGLSLKYISPSFWRNQCGAVLQDGFIFNDSIGKNIAVGYDQPDLDRLIYSCKIANILPFVESLPNGFNTSIGTDGIGISQGQKQRLLIARVVYKDPQYLFLDEATNALDANNEKAIVENLQQFLKGKTVVVVAHRLSTVKNADNIIVLQEGSIVEQGTHNELTLLRGKYYELVKNQLELGN